MRQTLSTFLFVMAITLVFSTNAHAEEGYAFLTSRQAADICKSAPSDLKNQAVKAAEGALNRQPHPVTQLVLQGTMPGEANTALEAIKDFPAARDLAVGYCASGRPEFRDHALAIFSAWLGTFHSDLDPINESNFEPFYLVADILRPVMDPKTTAAWNAFNQKFAEGYLAQAAEKAKIISDNWQSHRIKLATLSAFSLGDQSLIERAHAAFTTQLNGNLLADGSVYDFHRRDALHYVAYDLEPLITASVAARNHGQDWFHTRTSSGASLTGALQWLAPYASGQQNHEEFVHSQVEHDWKARSLGAKGMTGNWNPKQAGLLYSYATSLDPQWRNVALQLDPNPKLWKNLQLAGK